VNNFHLYQHIRIWSKIPFEHREFCVTIVTYQKARCKYPYPCQLRTYRVTALRPTPPLPVQLNWLRPKVKDRLPRELGEARRCFSHPRSVQQRFLSQAHSHITHHFRHTKQCQTQTKRNVL